MSMNENDRVERIDRHQTGQTPDRGKVAKGTDSVSDLATVLVVWDGEVSPTREYVRDLRKLGSNDTIPTYADHTRDEYATDVRRAAQHLRDLADSFEHNALRLDSAMSGEQSRHYPRTYAAARAVGSLQWDIANVGLDQLIRSAAAADTANRPEQD